MKIMKKIVILIFLGIQGLNFAGAHPFYVSLCQIDFNEETNGLEISLKIFADDLLKALEENGAKKLYLGEKRENKETDMYVVDYLNSKLDFIVNGKVREFSFIGKEIESNVTWIYLEINNIETLKKIEVECRLLTEIFPSQNNIFQVNNGKEIKTMLMNRQQYRDSIEY